MLCMHNCLIPHYNILILTRLASLTELRWGFFFFVNPSSGIKYNLPRDGTPYFFLSLLAGYRVSRTMCRKARPMSQVAAGKILR